MGAGIRRRRTTFASGSFRRACQSVNSARQCVCSLALWSALHPAVTGHGPSRKGEGCGAVAKPSRVLRACNRVFLQTSPECVPDTNLRRDELLQIANRVVRIALDAHLCAREQKVTQRAHTPGQRRIHLPSFRACRCTPPQSLCSAPRVLPALASPREGREKRKTHYLFAGMNLITPSFLLTKSRSFVFTVRAIFIPGQHCRLSVCVASRCFNTNQRSP